MQHCTPFYLTSRQTLSLLLDKWPFFPWPEPSSPFLLWTWLRFCFRPSSPAPCLAVHPTAPLPSSSNFPQRQEVPRRTRRAKIRAVVFIFIPIPMQIYGIGHKKHSKNLLSILHFLVPKQQFHRGMFGPKDPAGMLRRTDLHSQPSVRRSGRKKRQGRRNTNPKTKRKMKRRKHSDLFLKTSLTSGSSQSARG